MKKVTDLGENEVIHCPTEREAIEINRVLNPEWQTDNIKKAHDILGDKLCFRLVFNQRKHDTIDYYKRLGCTIHPASDFLPEDFYKVDEAHTSVVIDPVKHDVMMVSDPTIPSPELLAVYEALDSEGKKIMREKMPNVKWPEMKEYVQYKDKWRSYGLNFDSEIDKIVILYFKNCTPEIDHEKGEIRFVKNG